MVGSSPNPGVSSRFCWYDIHSCARGNAWRLAVETRRGNGCKSGACLRTRRRTRRRTSVFLRGPYRMHRPDRADSGLIDPLRVTRLLRESRPCVPMRAVEVERGEPRNASMAMIACCTIHRGRRSKNRYVPTRKPQKSANLAELLPQECLFAASRDCAALQAKVGS